MEKCARLACDQLYSVLRNIDENELNFFHVLLCNAFEQKGHIVFFGVGRELLALRGFAMRLHHLGFENVSVVGDMTTPNLQGSNDLLVVSAGPGYFSTVEAIVKQANNNKVSIVCFTAQPGGKIPKLCNFVINVPARTMADDDDDEESDKIEHDVLSMGSLYEGALFLLFEIIVDKCRKQLGVTRKQMVERHTNLE